MASLLFLCIQASKPFLPCVVSPEYTIMSVIVKSPWPPHLTSAKLQISTPASPSVCSQPVFCPSEACFKYSVCLSSISSLVGMLHLLHCNNFFRILDHDNHKRVLHWFWLQSYLHHIL